MSNREDFVELLNKYISGTTTAEEEKQFLVMVQEYADDPELEAALWESYQQSADMQFWTEDYRKVFAGRILQKMRHADEKQRSAVVPLQRKIFRYAIAAAVLVLLAAGAYLWLHNRKDAGKEQLANLAKVQPGKRGAVLTLDDGTELVLDSLRNGVVAEQQHAKAVLENGRLSYAATAADHENTAFNIMTTPKGRQFQLILPDGSKVWLNAASSIRYPVSFHGKNRNVELNGEAYFEIEPDSKKPFVVKTNNSVEVEVLGTRFNVNAYENEENISATLLEGAVRVKAFEQSTVLKPRQQTFAQRATQQLVKTNADINKVMAWKNGYFDFNNENLQLMMRQLERWYDIDITYEGKIPDIEFKGKMDRNVQLSDVLRFLKMFGIRARLEGRTLIISGS